MALQLCFNVPSTLAAGLAVKNSYKYTNIHSAVIHAHESKHTHIHTGVHTILHTCHYIHTHYTTSLHYLGSHPQYQVPSHTQIH